MKERNISVYSGESGSGKSNLLNLLLNIPGEKQVFFPEGEGPEPCTVKSQVCTPKPCIVLLQVYIGTLTLYSTITGTRTPKPCTVQSQAHIHLNPIQYNHSYKYI